MSQNEHLGQRIFQQNNCISCHSIYGLGGHMGPDLTNEISTKGLLFTRSYISFGGRRMPSHKLGPLKMNPLLAYLTFIDKTGEYPVKSFPKNAYGRFDK